MPARTRPPVLCLLHGGFWRMPHGRNQMTALSEDLVGRGFAVWNLEYRRLGVSTGGWPGTFDDVSTGIERLARLAAEGIELDLDRVIMIGHSAGGHLALWAAARRRREMTSGAGSGFRIKAVAGLAPLADLVRAFEMGVGGGAISALLGGTPTEQAERYRLASPHALLPLNVPQLVMHGTADTIAPIEISRGYARAARAAGDQVELRELPDTGHMDFLDPGSRAHAALCDWLARTLGD